MKKTIYRLHCPNGYYEDVTWKHLLFLVRIGVSESLKNCGDIQDDVTNAVHGLTKGLSAEEEKLNVVQFTLINRLLALYSSRAAFKYNSELANLYANRMEIVVVEAEQ